MKKLIVIFLLVISFNASSQLLLPVPDHIVIVILENHAYSQIINSPDAPYINALAIDNNSALFTNSYGVEHPSQPNYLDLYAGCNQGVTDDNIPANIPFTSPNLGKQLINAGKSFITYSEDLPSVGFNGNSSGKYQRKHNPAANWMGKGTNQIPENTNQPFSAFPSSNFNSLPTVCFVIPNQNNDMHDGTIAIGDKWIKDNMNTYIQWCKTNNSLFILTFDEDDFTTVNKILTIFSGQKIKKGQYSQTINHYSVLRTIEEMYGLDYACNASKATTINYCWAITTGIDNPAKDDNSVFVYPNPAKDEIVFYISEYLLTNKLTMNLLNNQGEKVKDLSINSSISKIQIKELTPGIYFYQLKNELKIIKTGKIIVE